MRIIDIGVFIFVFSAMMGAMSELHLFGATYTVGQLPEINTTEIAMSFNPPGAENYMPEGGWMPIPYVDAIVQQSVNWVVAGINVILRIVGPALHVGGLLKACIPFLPDEFCYAVTACTYVIYGLGMAEFMSNRGLKMMR